MKKKLVWCLMFCSLAVFARSSPYSLLLNFSSPVKVSVFTLKKPHRLVIDIPKKSLLTKITKYRYKQFKVGDHDKYLRLVLSGKNQFKYSIHKIKKSKHNWLYNFNIKNNSIYKPKIIVVIDPGHGGKDPGAIGYKHAKEKNIVLSLSKKLYKLLNKNNNFSVYLTRNKDVYLPLRKRLAVARQHRADCFLSIHADAYLNHRAHGVSVYALSERGASSESARWLANQENNSELMGGAKLNMDSHFLSKMLIDLQQEITSDKSLKLGSVFLHNLNQVAHLHHNKVGQAAFVVLKSPDIISLLVETGFVSNKNESRLLQSSKYQNKVAKALYNSLLKYYNIHINHGYKWVKVKRGDTLYAIAKHNKSSITELIKNNNLQNKKIYLGQKIKVRL